MAAVFVLEIRKSSVKISVNFYLVGEGEAPKETFSLFPKPIGKNRRRFLSNR